MGSYYTAQAPTVSEGFFLQPETRVLLGTEELWGSLDTSGWTYAAYTAPIGLQSGKGIELGQLESLAFSHVPTFTPVESANIRTTDVYILEGEETMATIGLREFRPEVLHMGIGTGTLYDVGNNERLITFGDKCDLLSRPLTLEFNDVSCQVPDVADIRYGITGGVLTLYDTFVSSGLPLDDFNAGTLTTVTFEFMVRPVIELARGNRLGNVYVW